MKQVNVLEAKTDLSKLLRLLETNREDIIRIARNGKPIAEMRAIRNDSSKRLGIAKGKFKTPDDFDVDNEFIASMLMGGEI